jgi:hypothetical protein
MSGESKGVDTAADAIYWIANRELELDLAALAQSVRIDQLEEWWQRLRGRLSLLLVLFPSRESELDDLKLRAVRHFIERREWIVRNFGGRRTTA